MLTCCLQRKWLAVCEKRHHQEGRLQRDMQSQTCVLTAEKSVHYSIVNLQGWWSRRRRSSRWRREGGIHRLCNQRIAQFPRSPSRCHGDDGPCSWGASHARCRWPARWWCCHCAWLKRKESKKCNKTVIKKRKEFPIFFKKERIAQFASTHCSWPSCGHVGAPSGPWWSETMRWGRLRPWPVGSGWSAWQWYEDPSSPGCSWRCHHRLSWATMHQKTHKHERQHDQDERQPKPISRKKKAACHFSQEWLFDQPYQTKRTDFGSEGWGSANLSTSGTQVDWKGKSVNKEHANNKTESKTQRETHRSWSR